MYTYTRTKEGLDRNQDENDKTRDAKKIIRCDTSSYKHYTYNVFK